MCPPPPSPDKLASPSTALQSLPWPRAPGKPCVLGSADYVSLRHVVSNLRQSPICAFDETRPCRPVGIPGNRDSLGVGKIVVNPGEEGFEYLDTPDRLTGRIDGPIVFRAEITDVAAGNAFGDCFKALEHVPERAIPDNQDIDLVDAEFGRHHTADLTEADVEGPIGALEQLQLDREFVFVGGVPMKEGFVEPSPAMPSPGPRRAASRGRSNGDWVVGILKWRFHRRQYLKRGNHPLADSIAVPAQKP